MALTGRSRFCASAFHRLDRHHVAGDHIEPLCKPAGQRDSVGRHLDWTQAASWGRRNSLLAGKADHRSQIAAMSRAQAHRDNSLPFDDEHAGLRRARSRMTARSIGCGNVTMVLPRSTRLN